MMRTFERIGDEHLLIEVIRRLRVHPTIFGGRTCPEGTSFEKVVAFFEPLGGLEQVNLQTLLTSGEVIATGHASMYKVGSKPRDNIRKSGCIRKLHPDARVSHRLYFTEYGTPIIPRFRSGKFGKRIQTSPKESETYWFLAIENLYVSADGLPASVSKKLLLPLVEPY